MEALLELSGQSVGIGGLMMSVVLLMKGYAGMLR